jgi:hypothetical protein
VGPSFGDKSFFPKHHAWGTHTVLAQVSLGCSVPKGRFPRCTHPYAARVLLHALDLHVLGLPPAFVLSQDQTLKLTVFACPKRPRPKPCPSRARRDPELSRMASIRWLNRTDLGCVDNRRPIVARRRPRISSIVHNVQEQKTPSGQFPRLSSGGGPTASERAYRRPFRRCQTVKSAGVDNTSASSLAQVGPMNPDRAPQPPAAGPEGLCQAIVTIEV